VCPVCRRLKAVLYIARLSNGVTVRYTYASVRYIGVSLRYKRVGVEYKGVKVLVLVASFDLQYKWKRM
jgi:hypothetical protein